MSQKENLKKLKDAFVSAVFSLNKAAQEASSTVVDLLDAVDDLGTLDGESLKRVLASANTPSIGSLNFANPLLKSDSLDPAAVAAAASGTALPGAQKRKRREKKPIDPDAPKKPLPAKLVFLNAEKKKVREARAAANEPALSMIELNELATKAWDDLPDHEKQTYIDLHRHNLEQYNTELLAYKAKKGIEGDDAAAAIAASAINFEHEPAATVDPSHINEFLENSTDAESEKKKRKKEKKEKKERKKREAEQQ